MQKIIFLIEDSLLLSKVLKRTIESYTPYRIIHLSDGARILEKINEYKPDLLILDYDLPGKNGIEVYDLVHATKGYEHIPAIILSAEPPQKQIAKRHLHCLSKPYKISNLLQMMEAALPQEESI